MAISRLECDRPPQLLRPFQAPQVPRHPLRPARNAALISLAGDLPISVLSDLFDISISTAMHWARHAGRDWNAYLAATHQERADPRRADDLRTERPLGHQHFQHNETGTVCRCRRHQAPPRGASRVSGCWAYAVEATVTMATRDQHSIRRMTLVLWTIATVREDADLPQRGFFLRRRAGTSSTERFDQLDGGEKWGSLNRGQDIGEVVAQCYELGKPPLIVNLAFHMSSRPVARACLMVQAGTSNWPLTHEPQFGATSSTADRPAMCWITQRIPERPRTVRRKGSDGGSRSHETVKLSTYKRGKMLKRICTKRIGLVALVAVLMITKLL